MAHKMTELKFNQWLEMDLWLTGIGLWVSFHYRLYEWICENKARSLGSGTEVTVDVSQSSSPLTFFDRFAFWANEVSLKLKTVSPPSKICIQ